MSGINRLLSRRDKQYGSHIENVKSLILSQTVLLQESSVGSSTSDSTFASSCASSYKHVPSSSCSVVSLAFPTQMAKKSPRLSATTDTVQSQTANSVDTYVLQPNTASSVLHGLFPEVEKKALSKVDDKKVNLYVSMTI